MQFMRQLGKLDRGGERKQNQNENYLAYIYLGL